VDLTDLTMRPIAGRDELGLFNQLPYILNSELADDLAQGRRRPEWMWAALRGDRLLARAAWWSRPRDDAPFLLDVLDIDDNLPGPARLSIGMRLLQTAMAAALPAGSPRADYSRFVPPGWRAPGPDSAPISHHLKILVDAGIFTRDKRGVWACYALRAGALQALAEILQPPH
jgi:hypothetical protein